MTATLVLEAIADAFARRRHVTGCVVHGGQGSEVRSKVGQGVLARYGLMFVDGSSHIRSG